MSLTDILRKAAIAATGLSAFFSVEKANAQTTWNTRGLSHEQIKDLITIGGQRDASPGDTIKFNQPSYTMPFEYNPFVVEIDNLTITGDGDSMDSTVIQNHPDVGDFNGLAFEFRATDCVIKNMAIENIQIGVKAERLPEGKIMRLLIDNVFVRNTDLSIFSASALDGDGDIDRKGRENFLLTNSVVRDSNVAFYSENQEKSEWARYGVLTKNTITNCNLGVINTWYCKDGDYPCECGKIFVPGVGRDDGNTFNGQREGQSFTSEFRCGNGGRLVVGEDTADNTIEFQVTNDTLYDLGIGIDNMETDPQESFWGYVAHRGSPRLGGANGKTIIRGGRKAFYGDHDKDGDVDMKDMQAFQNYFSGEELYTINDRANITWADWDGEIVRGRVKGVKINLADYANFVPAMTGPDELND